MRLRLLLEKIDNVSMDSLLTYFRVARHKEQVTDGWTTYFSPWNKRMVFRVSDGRMLGGLYASSRWEEVGGVEENRGYGAISLVARLLGVDNVRGNRFMICRTISKILGMRIPWLEEENRNGFVEMTDPVVSTEAFLREDFSIEALEALGCTARRLYTEDAGGSRVPLTGPDGPVFRLSFGPGFEKRGKEETNFDPERLHRDFGLYEADGYVTRKFWENRLEVSRIRKSHPLFPIFVFTQETKGSSCGIGEVWQPDWNGPIGKGCDGRRFVYSSASMRSKGVMSVDGDAVCRLVMAGEDVPSAVEAADTGEKLVTTRMMEEEDENGKRRQTEVDLSPSEVRVGNAVICQDALSAVRIYYALNTLSENYSYDPGLRGIFFHVLWRTSKSEWKNFDFSLLGRISTNLYIVYNTDKESCREAFKVCRMNPDVRMARLPENMSRMFRVFSDGVIKPAVSVRDFFSAYCMSEDERVLYNSDKNLMFLSFLTGALPVNPFIRKGGTDRKTGKDRTEYRIDSACLWQLMAASGYCREVDSDSSDLVGRYMHMDGCFVRTLDARSIIVAATECLREYARRWAFPGTEDFQKMMQAVSACRDITDLRATSLPVVTSDYRGGYGEKLDHFFYRNGALRITPDEIRFVPYSQVTFNVDKTEILPFDFCMPCVRGEEPFRIFENPEYQERLSRLEEHRKDTENYTQLQIQQEESELQLWSQTHRWQFDFKGKKPEEWWQPLQVIRCFANEEYEKETELHRGGESFSEEQERVLYSRMANIIYSLGRPLFRYRGGGTSYMPYITENRNSMNDRAEGGSGKSLFVNVFMGCSGKIYRVNARNLRPDSDIALSLDKFEPRVHRVVHWEDWPNGLKIDPLYNYLTSGFAYRHRHNDSIYVPFSESPGHVITSNYQQTYEDPSASGRVVPTGFSHCFNRGDVRRNKPERKVSAVMPGLRDDPQDMDLELRSQIAYINALAVQFCMNTPSRVFPPMGDLNERSQKKAMGDMFIIWAKDFFSHDHVFLCPIDLKTVFSEYIDLCDTSDDKKNKFSANTFRKKIMEYCADNGFVCNPDVCLNSVTERRNGYMRVKAWCRTVYFADETVWGPGRRKEVRELRQSQQCLFFVRTEEEAGKMTHERVSELLKEFYRKPDPAPCVDPETGRPYELTEEEQADWEIYMLKKQGNYARASKLSAERENSSPVMKGEAPEDGNLPF